MTYAAFLVQFVLLPTGLLALLVWRDRRRGVRLPPSLCSTPAWAAVLLHVLIAVAYTTPWDNYLIVTGVWRYDPNLVAGIFVGWVPIEEYCFFVLQPILIGLWIVWIAPRLRPSLSFKPSSTVRVTAVVALLPAWLLSAAQLSIGTAPQPTYLSLILVWALPPIMLQLGFGADILLRHRALVLTGIAVPTMYLIIADALAIGAGTWTINPQTSLGLTLLPSLPLEEAVFFLMTTVLITCGVVLLLAEESRARLAGWLPGGTARRRRGYSRTRTDLTVEARWLVHRATDTPTQRRAVGTGES